MKTGALEFLQNGRATDIVVLLQDITLLGREFGDFLIQDDEASAEHFQIQKIGSGYHLIDLGSTNGTFLNGARIEKSKLKVGDEVRVGSVVLRFAEIDVLSESDPNSLLSSLRDSLRTPSGEAWELINRLAKLREFTFTRCRLLFDIIYEDGSRQILRFTDRSVELGRDTRRGRFKLDQELSKIHASVRLGELGKLFVRDHKSTNGTYVNEEKVISERQFFPGDMIRIGRTRIWVRPELVNSARSALE